jgi:anti-sigma regulatory factor (Ser/Thr protein kinase)
MTVTSTAQFREAQIDLRLAPNSDAVSAARHSLDEFKDLLPPEKLEDVRLVVSELVTNSIRHAGLLPDDQILLRVVTWGGLVRGRVCDPGSGFEKPSEPRPRPDFSGGWGLPIVERISDRWGVERNSQTCVWFEID